MSSQEQVLNTIDFDTIINEAADKLRSLKLSVKSNKRLYDRLVFEIREIIKQGLMAYWTNAVVSGKKFQTNKNKLLLPWLLGLCESEADCNPYPEDSEINITTDHADIMKYYNKHGTYPVGIAQDRDQPDIDLDCLPEARDQIKEYAASRYGSRNVCSVGTVNSYLLKQSLLDCAKVFGLDKNEIMDLTTKLPESVNDMREGGFGICSNKVVDINGIEAECKTKHRQAKCPKCGSESTETPTIGKILEEMEDLRKYVEKTTVIKDLYGTVIKEVDHKTVVESALKLVGKYKSLGKHAGALIISNCDLFGRVPMYKKNGQWVSMWTEGRSPQLSKFGYNKWDILGLKNLKYIFECCKMIERNHPEISFGDNLCGMDENDPSRNIAAIYGENGVEQIIRLDDEKALALANEQKVDSIFQFDTDLARSILSNGVTSFFDLMAYNALGHPGPLQSIPEYVQRRDDPCKSWKKDEHPLIANLLEQTHGILVYQEDLAAVWQNIAGFTAAEAQEARKAVAKKWREKLKPIEAKWLSGASTVIGEEQAKKSWAKQVTFGRYAFNKSHSVSYTLTAFKCLWLKGHYAPEWWASVMSNCHPDKLPQYMAAAKREDVKFGTLNIGLLTENFTSNGKEVNLGLICLKKVGNKLANACADDTFKTYTGIEDFISRKKECNKTVMERLIKLGAFTEFHKNIKATWMWYLYSEVRLGKLSKTKDANILLCLKDLINSKFPGNKIDLDSDQVHYVQTIDKIFRLKNGFDDKKIEEERLAAVNRYKATFPKRNKIPPKVLNYKPPINTSLESFSELFDGLDYDLTDVLVFEKEFLGYHWHSPADCYLTDDDNCIRHFVESHSTVGYLDCVVSKVALTTTKSGSDMMKVFVTDKNGWQSIVILWSDYINDGIKKKLAPGKGVMLAVKYDAARRSFTLINKTVTPLDRAK